MFETDKAEFNSSHKTKVLNAANSDTFSKLGRQTYYCKHISQILQINSLLQMSYFEFYISAQERLFFAFLASDALQ